MIILLGMPKSGTSSFQTLFKKLGYKSYHWTKNGKHIGKMIENNKKNKKPLLCDFLDTDVITQMDVCINKDNCYWPQISDYKQMIKENPDAIFILNKRNPKELLSSFKRWGNLDKRLFTYNPEIIDDKTDDGFIEFVDNFYLEIESYFEERQHLKFISYDLINDKIEKLKTYIDIKNIKILPKMNVN
uniref:Sulfotransferase domain-containing protein n=1 Tax=viral metagenome TaxID=1070528 RepID=A0A6C0KWB0_9ZZZZ|tara:strand:- start:7969 stop:8529 length:561 start_codon:yes stop_codon:yes gene_type:complete